MGRFHVGVVSPPNVVPPKGHVLASSEALRPSSHSPPRGRPFSFLAPFRQHVTTAPHMATALLEVTDLACRRGGRPGLEGLKGDLSVAENLLAAERLRGAPPAEDRLDSALVAFDLSALASRAVRTLSAGQRRRTALARVVLAPALGWLLDEPLNALDAPAQAAFRTALATHLAAGGLAIAATHTDLGMPCRTLELGV